MDAKGRQHHQLNITGGGRRMRDLSSGMYRFPQPALTGQQSSCCTAIYGLEVLPGS